MLGVLVLDLGEAIGREGVDPCVGVGEQDRRVGGDESFLVLVTERFGADGLYLAATP